MVDYLIVGAGLYGAVIAHEATKKGKTCLVIDKRDHIGGNIYTEKINGIDIHKYGAHIFHTDDKEVWDYVNQLVTFNRFINSPLAKYQDQLFSLPFSMYTFREMWGIKTPKEAQQKIDEQREAYKTIEPKNLEEQAIKLIGKDIYEALIKGYTEKQWGRKATELPAFIIRRLPVRFTYDNNYFTDRYQGIPEEGYTTLIEKLLEGVEVKLNTDFFDDKENYEKQAHHIIYTGMIDQYFNYQYGHLAYRSLKFESEMMDTDNYQGNAVINYTEKDIPYTRIIEHQHFTLKLQKPTLITREYPKDWKPGDEPYYPINDEENNALYKQYRALADKQDKVIFGGRLGTYRYLDMDDIIRLALNLSEKLLLK